MKNKSIIEHDRHWLELSLAQQAIWLEAKLSDGSLYQLGGWARIPANLDEASVRHASSLVMARHDALRLRVDDEHPRQWLDNSVDPPISVLELNTNDDPDAAFHAHIEEAFASPLPWGNHPLFRIELIHAGVNLSYLLWRFHHMLADSISTSITMRHWAEAYLALTSDTAPELAPPSSYLPVIVSDSAYLKSPNYKQDLSYWTSRFDPLPPPLIMNGNTRTADQKGVSIADWSLDEHGCARFEQSAHNAEVTAQRALFAIFAMTLARRYGKSDIVSGIALHRRDLSNRHALGMLSGIMAVRFNFDLSWSLLQGVTKFSAQVDSDLRHQRLPVDNLSRSLGLFRTGRARLFEAVMSYLHPDSQYGESPIEGLPILTGTVASREASPISFHVTDLSGEGLAVRLCINTDFLDASEASMLLSLFQFALDEFVAKPSTLIQDLPSITPGERTTVVGKTSSEKYIEEWTV
jgi:hypothetical protein